MSDIADILGLGQDASSNSLQNKDAANLLQSFQKPKGTMGAPKQKKTKTKISREVLDLIGKDASSNSSATSSNIISGSNGFLSDNEISTPPIPAPIFKKRRTTAITANAKKDGWVWAAVSNPSRSETTTDPAKICFFHWIRADAAPQYHPISPRPKIEPEANPPIAYKKKYSDGWSLDDSTALIEACKKYDLRWPVIVDRLRCSSTLPANSTLRTRPIEELKAHYYKVQSEGVQRDSDDENMEDFDGESFIKKERVRRLHQDWLFRRTKEEELKETKLREELKIIDGLIRKAKKQAKQTHQASTSSKATATASAATTSIVHVPVLSMETSHWPPSKGRPTLSSTRLHKSEKTKGLSKAMTTKLQNYLKGLEIPESLQPTEDVCNLLEEIRGLALEAISTQSKV